MVQIYLLFTYFYMHLHCHMLKSVNIALTYIFQIVIAHNQIYLAVQPVKCFYSIQLNRQDKNRLNEKRYRLARLYYSSWI